MPAFFVDQQSVKTLAKSVRAAFGSDVKHMKVLRAISYALGVSPDALLNKLNRFASEGRDPEPPITPPKAFAERLATFLSTEYGRSIPVVDVRPLIEQATHQESTQDGSQIAEPGKGDAAFFQLLFLLEHDRDMRIPRPTNGLDLHNPHHQLVAALVAIEKDDPNSASMLREVLTTTPALLFDLLEFGFSIFGEFGDGEFGEPAETSKVGMSWIAMRMGLDFDLGLTSHEARVVGSVTGPKFSADRLRSLAIGELRRVDLKGRAFKIVEELEILAPDVTEAARRRKDFKPEQYLEFFGEEKPKPDRKARLAGLAEKKIAQAKGQGLMR
ncbi:hypothetical protein HFO56_22965 [Rhizobium laguerreae]|uniref:hypothetical protein n=1 Tax=Rhizobium laguerreae TaxID=1076926 RepID=UPI001C92A540|nr:hypothetical protein [Rhizobium laguerreae]MBY3155186.1 hypothetical protein [Rhizobium laguerreae]